MKKVLSAVAALGLVVIMATSCGIANNLVNNSSATSSGSTTGSALTSLLSQYLKDGKLDTSNLSNLINLATIASSIQGLKGQSSGSSILTDFASGLVTGSNNQISQTNSGTITNILANLASTVDLSSLASIMTRAGDVTQEEAAQVAKTPAVTNSTGALTEIFKLMGSGK